MTRINRLTGFAGWLRHVTSNSRLLCRLSIHRRLTVCFVFLIVLMLVGEGALLRQLHLIRAQAERLDGLIEELIEVQRVHTSLASLYDRLGVSAQFEDSVRLLKEWDTLRTGLLDEAQRTQAAFRDLPPEVKVDPTMLTTLESIERTLPSHLDAIRVLAASGDWEAVHLRLERQLRPLEFLSSELVKDVHRDAGEQRTQAALDVARMEHRMFLVVAITGFVTLLIAAGLGVAITRSITEPLGRLIEGFKALTRGEFQHQVCVIGEGELAHLGRVFNEATGKLRDLHETLRNREEVHRQSEHRLRTTSDPCHNRDGVDGGAKTMFGLSEHFFPVAQSLVEIPQLPRRFIEDSAEVCEFALPDHADLMLKFASGQRLEPFYQPPQWLRDATGDCYSEASGNQQRNESSDWHD